MSQTGLTLVSWGKLMRKAGYLGSARLSRIHDSCISDALSASSNVASDWQVFITSHSESPGCVPDFKTTVLKNLLEVKGVQSGNSL